MFFACLTWNKWYHPFLVFCICVFYELEHGVEFYFNYSGTVILMDESVCHGYECYRTYVPLGCSIICSTKSRLSIIATAWDKGLRSIVIYGKAIFLALYSFEPAFSLESSKFAYPALTFFVRGLIWLLYCKILLPMIMSGCVVVVSIPNFQ